MFLRPLCAFACYFGLFLSKAQGSTGTSNITEPAVARANNAGANVMLHTCTATSSGLCRVEAPDYLIIGAGGSGIQAALLLQKFNMSYTILEKEAVVGSFWTKHPVFGELISINKQIRNETQSLKYDWHSLLEAPLQMRNITKAFFPTGSNWHRYMTEVAKVSKLNIEFGLEVDHIADDGKPCVYLKGGMMRCAKYRLLLGTGLKRKREPLLEALGGIPYSQITKEMAVGRNVCVMGNGNAGFEIAQNVYDVAERVIVYGKEPARLSAVTRYTGDVRAKFFQVLENFHGKLLDTVDVFQGGHKQRFPKHEKLLNQTQMEIFSKGVLFLGHISRFKCEVLALATGFESYVPGLNIEGRFPPSNDWFTAEWNSNIHYIGWLMHERDFRRGAGGFLSGFRYLIRTLVHHIREKDHGIPYPKMSNLSKDDVVEHLLYRSQTADDLIILQDGLILRDAIVADETGQYSYYEGVPYQFFPEITEGHDVIYFYFSWGNGRTASNVFDSGFRYDDGRLINLFLHPVIELNGMVRDVLEDLLMEWNSPPFQRAIRKTIKAALIGDISLFREKSFHPYKRATFPNEQQNSYEGASHPQKIDQELARLLFEASKHLLDPNSVEKFRARMAEAFPNLLQLEALN